MTSKEDRHLYDLSHLTIGNILECNADLGGLGTEAQSMEEVANQLVTYFYTHFADTVSQDPSCVLVRFYKTHNFADLGITLRGFARSLTGGRPIAPTTKCLTLLATRGNRPEWNTRKRSLNHQAIPLLDEQMVAQSPMIAQLLHQLGFQVADILHSSLDLLIDIHKRSYNVFYVPEALDSPFIPAQEEFVIPYRIRSVVGFGGLLPSLDLFSVVLFSKVPISPEAANLFKSIALTVRGKLLPFAHGRIFME